MFAVCLHRYARTSVRYFVCNLKMVRKGGGGRGRGKNLRFTDAVDDRLPRNSSSLRMANPSAVELRNLRQKKRFDPNDLKKKADSTYIELQRGGRGFLLEYYSIKEGNLKNEKEQKKKSNPEMFAGPCPFFVCVKWTLCLFYLVDCYMVSLRL